VQSLSRSVGSGLCVAREPRLPRTHDRALIRGHFTQCPAGHQRCQVNESSRSGILAGLMRSVRNRLSWLLAIVLVLQLGGIVAPVVLSAAGVDVEDVCTCPDATHGATCPMHHGKTSGSQDSLNRCAMRSASAPVALGLLTLGSGAGIVPPVMTFHVSVQSSALHPVSGSSLSSRTELPDSPPPRR
jgi:hypothetical protein